MRLLGPTEEEEIKKAQMHLTKSVAEPTWTAALRISPSTRRVESRIIFCNASPYNSRVPSTSPTIVQVLPAMESGRWSPAHLKLPKPLSNEGGPLWSFQAADWSLNFRMRAPSTLEWALGRKSIFTLFEIPKFRRFIDQKKPDIVHAQSRLPAWVSFLAWRKRKSLQSRFVTTVNGAHSVSRYSEIMTSGERVICVSKTIQDYVTNNYPRAEVNRLRVIPHGIESAQYKPQFSPQPSRFHNGRLNSQKIQGRKIRPWPAASPD